VRAKHIVALDNRPPHVTTGQRTRLGVTLMRGQDEFVTSSSSGQVPPATRRRSMPHDRDSTPWSSRAICPAVP
jgi:hypothetical protein